MANEATLQSGFDISKGSANLYYSAQPKSFRATVEGTKGPTPGAVIATLTGVAVDLSGLDLPGGFARVYNKATEGFAVLGIHDGFEFYPFMDLLPGEGFTIRLSRLLGISIGTDDVGTGSYDTTQYKFWIKSVGVEESEVIVDAFDR